MDPKDLDAEIHPLKNEDGKLQENLGSQLKKEENLKGAPQQSRLSRCRTAAFFLSLFICLLVVFVISFIVPCPDRPEFQGMWRIDYNAAGASPPHPHDDIVPSGRAVSAARVSGNVRSTTFCLF